MTTSIERIGQRVLVCPSCTLTLYDAGPGRAFCTGDVSPANAMQPHSEVEMIPFVRASDAEYIERLEAALRAVVDAHHRTVKGSALHDPENVEWEDCECNSCRIAQAVLVKPQSDEEMRGS